MSGTDMHGAVAVVTGGARGIGAASVRRLAEAGARVVVADVRDDEGAALAAELGGDVRYAHLDVSRPEHWTAVIGSVVADWGGLRVLVNDAAILLHGPIETQSLEDYMAVVSVNQVGVWLGMRAATAPMRAAGGGSIVNMSSVGGIRGSATGAAYVATKFAVRGMTKTAALELGRYGIRVNSVLPGAVQTPMNQPDGPDGRLDEAYADLPLGRAAHARELAELVLFLASDAGSYCTGADFVADGGLSCGVAGVGQRLRLAERLRAGS